MRRLTIGLQVWVALILIGCMATIANANDPEAGWKWAKMTLVDNGDAASKGLVLFTTSDTTPGAAFRCVDGQLYAFLASKPSDMHELVARMTRRPKEWDISLIIGDDDPRDEKWMSLHGGRLYMVISRSTTQELFEVAESGGTFSFTRGRNKTVTFASPNDAGGLFMKFKERCGI